MRELAADFDEIVAAHYLSRMDDYMRRNTTRRGLSHAQRDPLMRLGLLVVAALVAARAAMRAGVFVLGR
jgi:hypothetical protein